MRSLPVYLTPVSNRESVKDTLGQVKVVNDSVVSHSDPERLDAFHSHGWKLVKHLAESVDPSLDPELIIRMNRGEGCVSLLSELIARCLF